MKIFREIYKEIQSFFKDDSTRLVQRRQQILTQPIDPNGIVFPDSWGAGLYKQRLKNEGYTPIEGIRHGQLFVRPMTQEEHLATTKFFAGEVSNHRIIHVLDQMSNQAEAGELTADTPLYRQTIETT